jgi:hypothetical protein
VLVCGVGRLVVCVCVCVCVCLIAASDSSCGSEDVVHCLWVVQSLWCVCVCVCVCVVEKALVWWRKGKVEGSRRRARRGVCVCVFP